MRSEDGIAALEREWAELSAQMKAHRDAGTDLSDLEVRVLAERQAAQGVILGGRPILSARVQSGWAPSSVYQLLRARGS